MKDIILGLVRHALTAGGGALAAQGLVTAADANALVGGALALLGLIMSILDKRKKNA